MAYALSTSTTARAITQSGTDATQATAMATLIASVVAAARSTAYTLGAYRMADVDTTATVGFWYQCTAAGTTGAAAPTWPTTAGGTVVDGTVTWTAVNRPSVVTVGTASANRKYVNFAGFQFNVTGTATVDDRAEEVIIGDATGPVVGVAITGTGTLKLGLAQTQISGLDWYTRQTALTIYNATTSALTSSITVNGTAGRLEIRGAAIGISSSSGTASYIRVYSGNTFYCRDGAIVSTNFSKDTRLRGELGAVIDIDGLRAIGIWFNQFEPWASTKGIVIENESGPEFSIQTTPANAFILWTDYDARKTVVGFYARKNFIMSVSPYIKFVNPYLGTNMDFLAQSNAAGKQPVAEIIRQVSISVATAAGAAITDAAFFCRDTNNGGRVNLTPASYSSPIDYVNDRTYYAVPNASGVIPTQDILLGLAHTSTDTWSRRTKGGNAYSGDLMDFHVWSYAYLYTALPNVPCAGFIGPISYALKLVADSTVTDTLANVAAYTDCGNLDKVRNYCKWMKTQQATMELPTIGTELCTASGSTLNFGAYNIVIDATAAQPVAFAGNTVTIKATTLTEGTRYKFFATTGTVTFANGATTTALYTDATGARWRVTVDGMVAGSALLIRRTDTQAVLFSGTPGTSYALTYIYTADIPVEIVVRKATSAPYYQEWRTTATLGASVSTITANQTLDQ